MTTTKGNVLISYDIDTLHLKVKKCLQDLGYIEKFKNFYESKIHYLPTTTLWHLEKSSEEAMLDLKITCKNLNVTIQKAIAIRATEFVGYS